MLEFNQSNEIFNANTTELQQNNINEHNFDVVGIASRTENTLNNVEEGLSLAREYCQKHPELVPFQDAIINEAMAALLESHLHDENQIDDREALERGIQRFQQKLGDYHQKQTQKQAKHNIQQQLLKLDTGVSMPKSQPHSISQTLKAIGDNDKAFSQYRQHYLGQKGIH